MGSSAPPPPFVSIVLTVRNEERHLPRLLESLLVQEPPYEVVLVDALSRDRTWEIVEAFAREHPEIFRAVRRPGSRGTGRNVGVALARGDLVAFIDGDCLADSNWLHALREGFRTSDVVAGRTVAVGPPQYALLERVELFERGNDVTYPSCNLGYPRALFLRLGGFDPRFTTAEDIDLNLRAIATGASLGSEVGAIVYHEMRPNILRFLVQAFWNGYGRKQLTEKHGSLWGHYRVRRLVSNQRTVISWVRLVGALAGYLSRVLTGVGRRLSEPSPRTPELSEAAAAPSTSGAGPRATDPAAPGPDRGPT